MKPKPPMPPVGDAAPGVPENPDEDEPEDEPEDEAEDEEAELTSSNGINPTNYLTFTGTEEFIIQANEYNNTRKHWNGTLYYSTDAINWTEWAGTEITSANKVLYLCGTGNTVITGNSSDKNWVITPQNNGTVACSGNIMTLLNYVTPSQASMAAYCFNSLFKDCGSLTTAPELPATTLADSCYYGMFSGCTSLTTAPELPATTLAAYCYYRMFAGCSNIHVYMQPTGEYTAPYMIPKGGAGTDANSALKDMFNSTAGDVYTPAINTTYYVKPIPVTGVSLTAPENSSSTITKGGSVALTATVAPKNASYKTVVWSVESETGSVTLYTDENCTIAVGTTPTDALKVYAKGVALGEATVTVTATNGTEATTDDFSASFAVTVNPYMPFGELDSGCYTLSQRVVLEGDVDLEGYINVTGEDVTLDLNGHTIDRGLSTATAKGYVINVSSGKKLTVTDSSTDQTGVITGGYNNSGGGVFVYGGTFNLQAGAISGNNTAGSGAGVFVTNNGSFTMEGGAISGNKAVQSGGVYVAYQGTFSMTGGTITGNNTAASFGGGVYVGNGTFSVSGRPTIADNVKNGTQGSYTVVYVKGENGSDSNVYLAQGKKITLAGALTNETPIGVTMQTPGVFTSGPDSEVLAKNYAAKFKTDNPNHAIVAQGDELELLPPAHGFTYTVSGATITATCTADGCPLDDGSAQHRHTAKLTIGAPAHSVYADGKDAAAIITDADGIRGDAAVSYYAANASGQKTGEKLGDAPVDAGKYWAEITLGTGSKAKTAHVVYTVAQADPICATPTNLTATYTDLLSSVEITNPTGNTDGTWANPAASVGNAGTRSFTATSTPNSANYKTVSGLALVLTVERSYPDAPAAPTATSITNSSVTLNTIPNGEYKMDNGEWQDSPSFTNLTTGETYTFYQRIKDNPNQHQSASSEGAPITVQIVKFNFWIGETQVTSDQPYATGWDYDMATNTLTLDGLVLPTKGRTISGDKFAGIAYLDSGTLNLVILGENIITFTDSSKTCYGLYTTGTFNISGTGSLEQLG